jgi:hypothetical protein
MVARRLLIVLAVLVALTALAAGVAPRERLGGGQGASAPPAGAPAPTRASGRVQKTLDASAIDQRVVARVGQTVVLTVRSKELATISLAESGDRTAEPDSPARFELLADVPGTYPIDRLETEQQIGTLEIRKAG